MTRLLLALGLAAVALSPALAAGKKNTTTHTTCKGYYYSADCAKRTLSPYQLSHPGKSKAVIKQLYVSKGFGR